MTNNLFRTGDMCAAKVNLSSTTSSLKEHSIFETA